MLLNPSIFREYDIRGKVGSDLIPETVDRISRAFAAYLFGLGTKSVVVARDNRLSSEGLCESATEAFLLSGLDVVDIGLCVTPMMYFARVYLGIDGGMMVTGSHNPPEYNGFKIAHADGTLYGEQIREIHRIAQNRAFVDGNGDLSRTDVSRAYLDSIVGRTKLGTKKLKVAVDCGNGTASLFAPGLLGLLGVDQIPLYCESDGRFPHHFPDPVAPSNLVDLRKLVLAENADLGIAFDGDADRIGVVDDRGGIVWGDALMALFWREVLQKYPGTHAIVEVKCSQALIDEITRLGGRPSFYKTGHSLIKARMREIGAVFTGEMSGHMFFADEYYGFDDALYAAARLLRLLSHSEKRLSEMLAELPQYMSTPEVRVDCPDEHKFAIVDEVKASLKERFQTIDIDGVRVLAHGGWGLIRASNTQPALVLRCEAHDQSSLDRLKALLGSELSRIADISAIAW